MDVYLLVLYIDYEASWACFATFFANILFSFENDSSDWVLTQDSWDSSNWAQILTENFYLKKSPNQTIVYNFLSKTDN
jgi:hypothetical protein